MNRSVAENDGILTEFLEASRNGEVMLLYYGLMNREVREHLMAALKLNLSKAHTVPPKFKRRAFSIADECITNIYQYYHATGKETAMTGISAYAKNGVLDFVFSNTVKKQDRERLEEHLKQVYNRPPEKLKQNFENNLQTELDQHEDKAGLGLIIVSQRALGNFDFHFEEQPDGNFLFHLRIGLDLE